MEREIALAGDTLEMEAGHPIINGFRVPSCPVGLFALPSRQGPRAGELEIEFLGNQSYFIWIERGLAPARQGPYRVNPGETWVLGDNRNNSADSRFWAGGRGAGVPDRNLRGRAFTVWLAFDARGNVDWERIGLDLLRPPRLTNSAPSERHARVRDCLARRPANTFPPPAAAL